LHSFWGVAERRGGEKQVKKAVLVVALALMVVALLANTVLAASPKKIPITAQQKAGYKPVEGVSRDWDVDGGISQNRDYIGIGSIKLNLPSDLGGTLTGIVSSNDVDFTPMEKNLMCIWHWEMTWSFPKGTFEGIYTEKLMGKQDSWEAHVVMHGTGDYEGWVLVLAGSFNAPPPAMNLEGTLLIP
jgi:hypothetical protein